MTLGLVLTSFNVFLLYKNTIHIHNSIIQYKTKLIDQILAQMELI